MPVQSTAMSIAREKNQHPFWVWYVSESQNICACTDGMFEQERKTQYLQTWRWSVEPNGVIPGFRPVPSHLDAVGPSLLSATELALPVRHRGRDMSAPKPYVTNSTPTHSSRPPLSLQFNVRFRWLKYSKEKSFLSYCKHWSRALQSVRTRPAKGNTANTSHLQKQRF